MDTTGASSNGSRSDIYVASDVISVDRFNNSLDTEDIRQGPATNLLCQVPSQPRRRSSTGPFRSAAATTTTTQQSTVVPELQYLVSASGLAVTSRDYSGPTPAIDPASRMGYSSKPFLRDASVPTLSNGVSAPPTLRRMPSMQDLRMHRIEESRSVNVSGPRLAPPFSFRLANASPSSYVGHEQYSGSSATGGKSKASFRMASPSCLVDTKPGLYGENQECSDRNYGHKYESEFGFDPNLKSAFEWGSDEEDNKEEGLKWRIKRLKKKLLA